MTTGLQEHRRMQAVKCCGLMPGVECIIRNIERAFLTTLNACFRRACLVGKECELRRYRRARSMLQLVRDQLGSAFAEELSGALRDRKESDHTLFRLND